MMTGILMRFLILICLTLVSTSLHGQHAIRLTNNSLYDGEAAIFNNRIVWSSSKWYGPRELYLIENNTTKRLTYDDYHDYAPQVNEKYVVWLRDENFGISCRNRALMCYDGINTKRLDYGTLNNFVGSDKGFKLGNGKYIFWIKEEEDTFYHNYLYDGVKISKDLVPPIKIISNGSVSVAPPTLVDDNIIFLREKSDTVSLIQYNLTDSIEKKIFSIAGGKIGDIRSKNKALLFTPNKGLENFNRYYYAKEVLHEVDIPDVGNHYLIDYDSTFISYVHRKKRNLEDYWFVIWRNGKYYPISQYPFTNVNYYEELKDIETVFYVGEYTYSGITAGQVYLYKDNKIQNVSVPGVLNDEIYVNGKYAVWNTFEIPVNTVVPTNFNSKELYTIYYDDTCKKTWYVEQQKIDAWYSHSQDNIAVKIITENKNKYSCNLYDMAGRLITTFTINTIYGENLHLFPALGIAHGIYIIEIIENGVSNKPYKKKLFITTK